MQRLTLYIAKHITQGILLALALVLAVELLFMLVNELRYVGKGEYSFWQMAAYVGLCLPQKLYQFFPMAALLGTLMGLGTLAQRSELIVMRAAGWSIFQISMSVLKTAFLLTLIAWILGEGIAPFTDKIGNDLRATALSGGQAMRTTHGTWMRDGADFVHIRSMNVEKRIEGITRYQFDQDLKLTKSIFARYADYVKDHWVLHDIQETSLMPDRVLTEILAEQQWYSVIEPDILGVVGVKDPDQLSIMGLWRTIQYRQANGLNSAILELAFWEKWIQPLTTIVMMLLAIPFIFGPLRQSTMGLKILIGIVVGFGFHTFNSLFGPLILVYSAPPIIGALLPTLLFAGFGGYVTKRVI
jgi:lipopolysaccharide export system permease protein